MVFSKEKNQQTATEVLGFVTRKHQDWFDDLDNEARTILDTMHCTHLAWICDKTNFTLKRTYNDAKSTAQSKLHEMKNNWWQTKAIELQSAADKHDLRAF